MSQGLPVTSYALLGLLTLGDEPTGYELKQRADSTLRYYWTAPAMSQVYSELDRLHRERLVALVSGTNGTPSKPARYRITDHGRERLQQWLTDSPAGFPVLKHPVALRLMMGRLGGDEQVRALLGDYLQELAANRADLAAVRASLVGRDGVDEAFRYPAMVADWGLAYFDSEADIAREMLQRLD